MALLDDFKARFPGIATATADTYVPILEDVWPEHFGGDYNADNKEIILQLVAHLVVTEAATGNAPAQLEASRSVGSVSVSFAAGAGAAPNDFAATRYGQRYLQLLRQRGGAVFV